jgi:hypothetical protein
MLRLVRHLIPYMVSRGYTKRCNPLNLEAGLTRLELATSDVTGRRSNQLNYSPARDEAGAPAVTMAHLDGRAKYMSRQLNAAIPR